MRAYELAAKGHTAAEISADLKVYQREYACLEMTIRDISYGRLTGRLNKDLMPEFALNHIENNKKGICMGYQFQKYKKKDPGIPNSWPFKRQLLQQVSLSDASASHARLNAGGSTIGRVLSRLDTRHKNMYVPSQTCYG